MYKDRPLVCSGSVALRLWVLSECDRESSSVATDSSPSAPEDGEGSADAGAEPTTSFELTVINGFGSGSHESGSMYRTSA